MTGPTSNEAAFEDLEPLAYGEGIEAPLFIYGIDVLVPGLAIGVLLAGWARRRWRALLAERAEAGSGEAPKEPGERVVRGTVRDVESGGAAVRVTVEQHGTEHEQKSSWKTTWTEISRRVESSPFELELDDGSRLRVEPGEEARLVDALGPWERVDGSTRLARAELEPGERVVVTGELVHAPDPRGGYRGGQALVLRAKQGEPMLLSTKGLAAPARAEARRCARWAAALVLAALLAQLFALPYHLAVWAGERQSATIEERWESPAAKKKQATYFVRYRLTEGGAVAEDEVTEEDYRRLAVGVVVPVHVSPLQITLGPHPTIHGMLAMIPSAGLIALAILALRGAFRATAWYERRLHAEVAGRLESDD